MSQSPPRLFDRDVILHRRMRAARIAGDLFLRQEAVEAVAERLSTVNRHFGRGVLIDSGSDVPGVLAQIRRALKPDGLFMAALFGGATLFELRESLAAAELETTGGVSPRIYPFADVRDLGGLLQRAGFALPVADVERTTVLYREFSSLVRDLRALGETNALAERSLRPLSRETLAAMLAHYGAHHAEPDGRLRAPFEIVYLTGWAPHESQQQPQ